MSVDSNFLYLLNSPCFTPMVSGAITWNRTVVSYTNNNGTVDMKETIMDEGRALIVVSTETIADKISDNSLEAWAARTKQLMSGKHLTLLLYNYQEYFRSERNARERVKTASVRGENPARRDLNRANSQVSKYDLEEALVSLSLDNIVDHLTFSGGSKGKDI